jgi:hypothetical protein
MHYWVQRALSPLVVLSVCTWAVLLFFCPVGVAADKTPPVPRSATSETAAAAEESPPLTAAQQEAQNLATALLEKQEGASTPSPSPSLSLRAEQPLRPGERLYILLFSWLGLHMYLVSGQQTLASPVDGSILVSTDALPVVPTQPHDVPSDAMAIGVLVK